ncbi:MAG: hypothetical protein A4S09_07175 [Proteobacteria bacterium SG_bin7]|nr:MAG: hypothetical protein A4S09_07175 [Proteobacteria bacterium SG_bin7]
MFRFGFKLLVVFSLVMLAACSRHWREGDPGITDEELQPKVMEALQLAANQADAERFKQLFSDQNATVFYAESGSAMGPAQNVTAMYSWDFLSGQGAQSFAPETIEKSRVIFIDIPYEDRIQNAILFDITVGGQHIVKIYFNDKNSTDVEPTFFDNGEFVSQMSSSDGSHILLRSFDTDDDVLQSVIQLEVYTWDVDGTELLNGKVTTLVGFEP